MKNDSIQVKIESIKEDLQNLLKLPDFIINHFILDDFNISKEQLSDIKFLFTNNQDLIFNRIDLVLSAFDLNNKFFAKNYIALRNEKSSEVIHDSYFIEQTIKITSSEPSATNQIIFSILFNLHSSNNELFFRFINNICPATFRQLLKFIITKGQDVDLYSELFILEYIPKMTRIVDVKDKMDYLDIFYLFLSKHGEYKNLDQGLNCFFQMLLSNPKVFLSTVSPKLPLDEIISHKKLSFNQKSNIITNIFNHPHFAELTIREKTVKFFSSFRFQNNPEQARLLLKYLIKNNFITTDFDDLYIYCAIKPIVLNNEVFIKFLLSHNVDFNKTRQHLQSLTMTHFIFTNNYNMHLDWTGCNQNIILHSYKNCLKFRQTLDQLNFKNPIPLLEKRNISPLFSYVTPSSKMKELLLKSKTPKDLAIGLFGSSEKRFRKLSMDKLIVSNDKKTEELKKILPFHIDINEADSLEFSIKKHIENPQGFNNSYFDFIEKLDLVNLIKSKDILYGVCSLNINFPFIKHYLSHLPRILKFIQEDKIKTVLEPFCLSKELVDQEFLNQLRDTCEMCKTMQTRFESYVIKAKSIKELHDQLFYDLMLKTHENVQLENQKSYPLDNAEITIDGDLFKIIIPKNKFDLLSCGNSLSFCIGTANYHERINKGELYAFIIYKNNQLYGAITLKQKDLSFDQANIKRNKPFETNELHKLLSLIRFQLSNDQINN
jgi:hypothetical protein